MRDFGKGVGVMRIGILTGGGDAPGMNAAIRAIVRKGTAVHGAEMLGFRNGWRGVMDGDVRELRKAITVSCWWRCRPITCLGVKGLRRSQIEDKLSRPARA